MNRTFRWPTYGTNELCRCRKEAKYLLPKPALVLPEPKPSHWLRIVQEYFQATVQLTPLEAKAEFLNKLQRWTLFGSSFFFVTVRQ